MVTVAACEVITEVGWGVTVVAFTVQAGITRWFVSVSITWEVAVTLVTWEVVVALMVWWIRVGPSCEPVFSEWPSTWVWWWRIVWCVVCSVELQVSKVSSCNSKNIFIVIWFIACAVGMERVKAIGDRGSVVGVESSKEFCVALIA